MPSQEESAKGSSRDRPPRVLAVASGGGHWEQLMLLRPAIEGFDLHFATTVAGFEAQLAPHPVAIVPDCNANERIASVRALLAIGRLLLRIRPDVVISTGALPGLFALLIAKRLGARTIWVDSIANAQSFSRSGRRARGVADLWLTQWPALAADQNAEYAGSVL